MGNINKEKQAAMPQKLLHELFDYNELTGVWVNKTNRGTRAKAGQPAGCVNSRGYVKIRINGYEYRAHRLAWTYTYGDYPDGKQPFIDHINGNPSDNRIVNLRASSGAENNRNQKKDPRNKSTITGVRRIAAPNNSKKNPKINYYWMAQWCDESGKLCRKNFNIEKLGEEVAKQLAISYRAEQIRLLELNFGIIYSDRHGT